MAGMQGQLGSSPLVDRAASTWRVPAAAAVAGWCCVAALVAQGQELERERIADDEELTVLLRDQTIRGVYSDGDEWIEYHAPDGRSAYWDGCSHVGEWWIADGMACYRYRDDPSHADHCWYVYRKGERIEFVYFPEGTEGPVGAYSLEISRGNPEHLPLNRTDCLSASAGGFSSAISN